MLSCNLWVLAILVNGALGVVVQIVHAPGHSPPNFPSYVVVEFDKYIDPPWDKTQPKYVPLPPIQRRIKKQIPLKMTWSLIIHKS